MTKRQTRMTCWCGSALLLLVAGAAWAQDGQAELDKAMDLKITATNLNELAEVATLCEKAIEKGLGQEDEAFAKQLLTGALYQRAERICQPLVHAPVMTPDLKKMRDLVMPDLEKIIKYDEKFGPAHLRIAQLYALDGGDLQKTRQAVDRAVDCLQSDNKMLAEALLLRSPLQESDVQQLADCDRAIELDPANPDTWQTRAMYHLRHGDMPKAVSDFNSLIEQDPDNLLVRLAVAEALIGMELYDEALKHINLVIEKKPSALAYTLRARLWTQQEKLDEAVKDLDEAAKLEPTDLSLLLMRARLYHAEGRNALAQQDVERVLQVRPGVVPAIELRSSILAAMGKFPEAINDISELLKKEPDNVLLKLQLAIYLNADNRSAKAIEVFSEILQAELPEPQKGVAFRGRADAYLNIGEHRKALADYEEALKVFADESGLLNNFAWVLATSPEDEIRNGKRALEMGLKACELTEYKQSHIVSTLAAAYAETGDFESAVKWSQKSVELGDEDIQPQLKLELESYQQKKPWREKKSEAAPQPETKPDAGSPP
ncbi:MAG: tetratricopeptide repeat protein [Pirellulaceae bacterium]